MDIAFKPPVPMLVILGVIVVVAVLAALLKKMETWKKVLTIVLAVGVCGAVFFFLFRTTHLVVDDAGIHTDTYGRQSILWSSVSKTILVENLSATPYAPVLRTNGVSVGDFKSGWFRLADGSTAFVTAEIAGRALVIQGDGKTFVFAPRELDAFAAEVAKHAQVAREGGGGS
jgi:hypothetical protein